MLTVVKKMQSEARQKIVLEICQLIPRINKAGIIVKFIWIPAHIWKRIGRQINKMIMTVNYSEA